MASQSPHSTYANQPQTWANELTIDDLGDVQNVLHGVASKCFNFGLQLKVKYTTLCKIKHNYGDIDDQLREILAHRLTQLPPLTWHHIIQALRSNAVQMNDLASQIESQHIFKPPVAASQQVMSTHATTAPSQSAPHSVSWATTQPILSIHSIQPHPPPQPSPHLQVHVLVDNLSPISSRPLNPQSHPPQHPPSNPPPPNPPTSTPSQPQAEAAQPPSSSQPSSSQLMSVPVTSQAMPGPSPQLSQDVATPHPLQEGGQQALQGQPPLQHIPSHQPQTVAQLHGTGSDSGPPQAKRRRHKPLVAQRQGTGSDSDPSHAEEVHYDSPIALQSNAVQMNDLASEIESQHMCQSSHDPQGMAQSHGTGCDNESSQVRRNRKSQMAQSHDRGSDSEPPRGKNKHKQPISHSHYLQGDASSSNPPTSTPSQPQAEAAQPPSSSQPSSSQLMSAPVTSQAMPGPSPQLSQDVGTPHPLQVGEQQALQGQPPLQHIPSHQPQTVAQSQGAGSDSGPPQGCKSPVAPRHGTGPNSDSPHVEVVHYQSPIALQSNAVQMNDLASEIESQHMCQSSHEPQGIAQSHGTSFDSESPQVRRKHKSRMAPSHDSGSDSDTPQANRKRKSRIAQSHDSSSTPQAKRKRRLQMAHSHDSGSDSDAPQVKRKCKSQIAQSRDSGSDSDTPHRKMRHKQRIAQYIKHYKALYRQSEVEKKLNAIKWPPTPSTVYINLVCVDRTTHVSKKEADECTRAMVCDGSVDVVLGKKTPIELSDIAKDVPPSERKVILVEGAPGVGKSTLSWEFCRKWERGEIAQQYKLVLLLRLRDKGMSEAQSLGDLLYHPSKAVVQAVEDELIATLGANTLIILEGFDELPSTCRTQSSVFLRLINGMLLPHATVLVTSRPWATQDIHQECHDHIFQHIEILGFTSKQIEEYVTSVFTDGGKLSGDRVRENIEEVMSYIKTYPQIQSCMYIPLNSAIVVSVYQESKAGRCILPKTLTELYLALTQTILLRYLYGHPEYGQRRWKIQSLKEGLPPDAYSKLLAISELAYSGICTDQEGSVQLIFTNLPPGFETLGPMQSVPQLYVTQGEEVSYNFLHLTVQEFLAALHISNMSPEKQLEHFQGHQEEGRWKVVLRFLAGITKLASISPEDLKGLLLDKPNEDHIAACRQEVYYPVTPDVVLSSEHVHWMFETQRDNIVPLVLQERTVEFRGQQGLTPLDYYSLGYCIVHSHCQWVLTIEDNEIGEEEVRMLVAGANTRSGTSARVVGLRGQRDDGGGHYSLSMSAEAMHTLFTGLENVIHLQELHLVLPEEGSSIQWPDMSGLRVLYLEISDERN